MRAFIICYHPGQTSNAQRSSLCMTSLCFLNDDGKLNSISQSLQEVPASDASLCLYFGGSSGFVHLQIYIHNSCNYTLVGTHRYPHQRDACDPGVLLSYDSPNFCWKLSLCDKLYSKQCWFLHHGYVSTSCDTPVYSYYRNLSHTRCMLPSCPLHLDPSQKHLAQTNEYFGCAFLNIWGLYTICSKDDSTFHYFQTWS